MTPTIKIKVRDKTDKNEKSKVKNGNTAKLTKGEALKPGSRKWLLDSSMAVVDSSQIITKTIENNSTK